MSDSAHRKAQTSTSDVSVPHKDVDILGRGRRSQPPTPSRNQWSGAGVQKPSYGPQSNSSTGSSPKNHTNMRKG